MALAGEVGVTTLYKRRECFTSQNYRGQNCCLFFFFLFHFFGKVYFHMDFEINNSSKRRFTVSPRLAATSRPLKGPRCFSGPPWESEGKDWPHRVFGQIRTAHGLELFLMGEGVSSICLKFAQKLAGFCKRQNLIP